MYVSTIASYSKNSHIYVVSYNVHWSVCADWALLQLLSEVVGSNWSLVLEENCKLSTTVHTITETSSRVIIRGVEDDSMSEIVPVGVSFSVPLLAGRVILQQEYWVGHSLAKRLPLSIGYWVDSLLVAPQSTLNDCPGRVRDWSLPGLRACILLTA